MTSNSQPHPRNEFGSADLPSEHRDTKVLVVDDQEAMADLTATYLHREDEAFEVVAETSTSSALDRLADEQFDCVVSDYDMPDGDGLEFLAAVRDRHPDVPFILFTSRGSESIASEAITAGVTDYLQKGGSEQYELLANRIANVVEQHRRGQALTAQREQLNTLVDNLPGMVYRAAAEEPWPMTYVGGSVESLTGYSQAAFERGDVTFGDTLIVADDVDSVSNEVTESVAAGEAFEVTYTIETVDGTEKEVWEQGTPIFEDGDVAALEGVVMDVSALVERGEALATD